GPNLWPDDRRWRETILLLMRDLEEAGRDVLNGLGAFLWAGEEPYLLLKLIHYPPSQTPRSGVAPHTDFSWITLLLQDDTGGLEVQRRDGAWIAVPGVPGTIVVNVGEILQFATRGEFPATPHRVVNRSRSVSRISLPFFLNPALDRWIAPATSGNPEPRYAG